jgi:hypothetical protein
MLRILSVIVFDLGGSEVVLAVFLLRLDGSVCVLRWRVGRVGR